MTLVLNVIMMLMGFVIIVLGGDGIWVVGVAMVVLSVALMGPAYHESERERRERERTRG